MVEFRRTGHMKKNFYSITSLFVLFGLFLSACLPSSRAESKTVQDIKALQATYSQIRLESEGKLIVPPAMLEEVWAYLLQRLVTDKTFIKSLDPNLDSFWYDELFTDDYFDTPDLVLLDRESGIRHRSRVNLTNPEFEKSGRELIQIKLNNIDSNKLNRGEIKFDIKPSKKLNNPDNFFPVLGLIKPVDRPAFKQIMKQLDIDPYSLIKMLTIHQRRRSIYLTRDGGQFISIRLDEVSSDLLWEKFRHIEIEPEINEIPYTSASDDQKRVMESINAKIIEDIRQHFPEIKMDLTPKYNKAYNYFESRIPFLRFLLANNMIN
jgi:hypothetical protein